MKPMSIQQGQWCPECSSARNERICKKIFEITFNAKFPKTRPQWLRSNKNHPLELDGFCRNLNLAFEYQGRQHYALSRNFFGLKNNDELLENDKLKKKLCENKGVILIEVPYQVKVNEMQNYIVDQCKKKHVDLPKIIPPIDFSKIDVYSDENLKSLQKISKKKGGFCLSEKYLGTLAKLSWQCSYGHTWEATPSSIRSGYWCPKCAGKQKLSIEEMREVAKKYNGECLSKKYINNRTKLEWRCVNGHTWKATASDVRAGHWCLKCSAQKIAEKVRKYDIADMEKVANKKQGKCLSKKFLSIHKKLMWQCLNKHKWMAQPANVMRGSWCPICAKDRYKILKNEKIKL